MSKESQAQCPCCGKLRNVHLQKSLLKAQQAFSDHWICQGDWAVRYALEGSIRWACDACLRAHRAIEGRPGKQTFVDHKPYLAYFDRTFLCEGCHASFVFNAREQQYWYEELQFWVQSFPKERLECRKKRRAKNKAMQEIQKELPQLDAQNPQQLLRMAELFLEAGSFQKASEYLARARKRAASCGELETLADQWRDCDSKFKIEGESDL